MTIRLITTVDDRYVEVAHVLDSLIPGLGTFAGLLFCGLKYDTDPCIWFSCRFDFLTSRQLFLATTRSLSLSLVGSFVTVDGRSHGRD